MDQDFAGRVALLTGATRGIGLAIAQELVDRGACVVITARKPDDLEQAVAELDPEGTGRAASARGSADDQEHQAAAVALAWSATAGLTTWSTMPPSTRSTGR